MTADLTLGDYEIDESNGDLVIRDQADNIVLRYDDTQAQWEFPTAAAVDIAELIDGAGVSHTGELKDATDDPATHASTHEDGGADEITVTGLSGDLADAQEPKTHASTHAAGGTDSLAGEQVDVGQLDVDGSVVASTVAASGQVTLSSGEATVDTGISATDATFSVALGVDDPGSDVDVAARLFFDTSAGTYKINFVESSTSVGNPTVNYDVVRVR
jgi:hypothetical protein